MTKLAIAQTDAQDVVSVFAEQAIEGVLENFGIEVEVDDNEMDYNKVMAVKQAIMDLLTDHATLEIK